MNNLEKAQNLYALIGRGPHFSITFPANFVFMIACKSVRFSLLFRYIILKTGQVDNLVPRDMNNVFETREKGMEQPLYHRKERQYYWAADEGECMRAASFRGPGG